MKVVDLTYPLDAAVPVFPGDTPVTLARVNHHERDGYQTTSISLGSHSGTHLDAPRHFFPDGATLDSFPVDRFVRRGWVVDVRPPRQPAVESDGEAPTTTEATWPERPEQPSETFPPSPPLASPLVTFAPGPAMTAPGSAISLAAAEAALAAGSPPMGSAGPTTSPLPAPAIVRIASAWLVQRLREATIQSGDFLLLWTGGALLADDAVPPLLESRAGLVGTDAYSLDAPPYQAHRLLLGAGVLLAENLANLDKLGPGPVMCAFLPLLWPEADGAPMRAVAWR